MSISKINFLLILFEKRNLVVPRDSKDHLILNKFIYLLLDKKVNRRVCNFNKLKQTEFLMDFNWDDLISYRMKSPYVPESNNFEEEKKKHDILYEIYNETNTKVKIKY